MDMIIYIKECNKLSECVFIDPQWITCFKTMINVWSFRNVF